MISVEEARSRASAAIAKRLREWAADPREAHTAQLRIALHAPSERDALSDLGATRAWRDAWAAVDRAQMPGFTVRWETRVWPSVGTQAVPTHAELTGADVIASFAGMNDWARARRRADAVRRSIGDSDEVRAAIRAQLTRLVEYDDRRFADVLDVATWLIRNPATGFRPRQVPVRGVDSKWLGAHRGVVTALVSAVVGGSGLGLVEADPLIRVRILDPMLHVAGPQDFAAPLDQLAALELAPPIVLVCENLESVLALPSLDGVVAIHGSGYAVGMIDQLPWVRAARVLYWGDLDSNGFAILHVLRSHMPEATSMLMDAATLLEHRDLWVPEPRPARGSYPTLTPAESDTLELLRTEGGVRLEQERIPWARALEAIRGAI